MNREVFGAILEAQDRVYSDPEHQHFLEEYEYLNRRFLQQLETMNPEQQSAVMEYCGAFIEMQLRTWKCILEQMQEGESK
nr:hypothetical protein [Oscillospiraceae bacterium]